MLNRIFQKLFFVLPTLGFFRYLNLVAKIFGSGELTGGIRLFHKMRSTLPLTVERDGLIFDASNKTPASRGIRLKEKEPDMINWLDDHLQASDIFLDVGANVGIYSLYAARICKQVVAIEPESLNYATLNKNIFLNQLDQKIVALNVALHDEDFVSQLNVRDFQEGKSGHNFHYELNDQLDPFDPVFKQSVIGLRFDSLVKNYGVTMPNLIKIDVDGQELRVVQGMKELLRNHLVRTIVIETNCRNVEHGLIQEILGGFGFILSDESRYENQEYRGIGIENKFYFRG
jgi:FkbM family methyltransferase